MRHTFKASWGFLRIIAHMPINACSFSSLSAISRKAILQFAKYLDNFGASSSGQNIPIRPIVIAVFSSSVRAVIGRHMSSTSKSHTWRSGSQDCTLFSRACCKMVNNNHNYILCLCWKVNHAKIIAKQINKQPSGITKLNIDEDSKSTLLFPILMKLFSAKTWT